MFQKIKNIWFGLSDKIRFLFVGGFNAGVQYLMYVALVLMLGENYYQLSLALSWFLSSFISFTMQKYLVFNVEGNVVKQYLKCCTTWFFSYLINAFLLEFLVQQIKINVYISQIIATGLAAVFTYVMFKVFAFRGKNDNK